MSTKPQNAMLVRGLKSPKTPIKKEVFFTEKKRDDECRKIIIKFRVNEKEAEIIEKKFRNSGFKSKSDFIRMAIYACQIIRIDNKSIAEFRRNLSSISNNVNQIAVRVNSTGNFYKEDFNDIQKGIDMLRQQLKLFQSVLQNTKPSLTLPMLKKQKMDD